MGFALGMVAGSVLSFVVWVAYFGPKHWEWYQRHKEDQATIKRLAEERDHYKHLANPSDWGTVQEHEARIVPKKSTLWDDEDVSAGPIEHRFDDIMDGGK